MSEYLVEVESKESLAIRRLMGLGFYLSKIMGSLGLYDPFPWTLWYILEIKYECLVKSFKGDVDILAGRLTWKDPEKFKALVEQMTRNHPGWHPDRYLELSAWKLAEAGDIKWPPSMDYLVGIEAKCAYLNPQGEVKSTKSGKNKKIRNQVDLLLQMGFNRFALLDFIANPPVTGNNSQAWLEAWYVAQRSVMFERSRGGMSDVLGERLPDNSPSGHWVLSMGAVVGGDESMRGAGSPKKLREARDNPLLQNSVTQANRKEMEANLSSILASLSMPRSFPVIFVNCRACGKIHRYNLEQEICGQYK